MAAKQLDILPFPPRLQLDELEERDDKATEEHGESVERQLSSLIALHGPNPDRIVAFLARLQPWARQRLGLRLRADYGKEAADVLLRCANNGGIYDRNHPAIVRLGRASQKGTRGQAELLAEAARKRAAGEKVALPDGAKDGAQPLPSSIRADLEAAIGRSAAGIQVVTGPAASEAAKAVGARALTTDATVFIPSERFDPSSPEGRRLLLHEAVHALQQRGGGDGHAGLSSPAAEAEAHAISHHVLDGNHGVVDMGVGMGAAAVARDTGDTPANEGGSAEKQIKFKLGGKNVEVKATVAHGGAQVQISSAKLASLMPRGVTLTQNQITLSVDDGGHIKGAFTIQARFNAPAPLKPVTFTLHGDTSGNLTATFDLEVEVPGLLDGKAKVTLDNGKVDATIEADCKTGNAAVVGAGKISVEVKDGQIQSAKSTATIKLPQGLGTAKVNAHYGGGKISADADLDVSLPGLNHITGKVNWDEGKGFTIPAPGIDVSLANIPGVQGNVKIAFDGAQVTVDGKGIKFKPKILQGVTVETITISEKGLSADVKIDKSKLQVPGWFTITNFAGSLSLEGATLTAGSATGQFSIPDAKTTGSFNLSMNGEACEAVVKVAAVNLAPNVVTITQPITFKLDMDKGQDALEMSGGLHLKLGALGESDITDLQFKGGHFTGKAEVTINKGPVKGLKVKAELVQGAPYLKAEADASAVGMKLALPASAGLKAEATINKCVISLTGDLSDIQGSVGGDFKLEDGKLADGTFDLKVSKTDISGDITANVKAIPGLKLQSASLKLHVANGHVTPSGAATFAFEQYIKGTVTVSYSDGGGFKVEGKALTVDIPNFPFDVHPFDATYEGGKINIPEITGTLKSGAVPGVKSATLSGHYVDGKVSFEVKDVSFAIPRLKGDGITVTWADGKWTVGGTLTAELANNVKLTATFSGGNGDGKLSFDCDLELTADNIKGIVPGAEVKSASAKIHYKDGKLTFDGAKVDLSFAQGALEGNIDFKFNEADGTFSGTGAFHLDLHGIKAKGDITVTLDHNQIKQVSLDNLELELPKGKATLKGTASFGSGQFNCDLTGEVTDIPLVEKATCHVVVTNGAVSSFEASGTLKKLPGFDMSGVTLTGKYDGTNFFFGADGDIKISGLKDPIHFHLLVGGGHWECGISGTVNIKGIGAAQLGVQLSDNGDFQVDLTFTPANTHLVKGATVNVTRSGGNITWKGSVTINIAEKFEGTVAIAKEGDGDFTFQGTITPTKASDGTGERKSLFHKDMGIGQDIPLFGIPMVADVHLHVGVSGGIDLGLVMPSLTLISASVSGSLSQLESGQLPNAEVQVKLDAGVYASGNIDAVLGAGVSVLGLSLNLNASAGVQLSANALASATGKLALSGGTFTIGADLSIGAAASLDFVIALHAAASALGFNLFDQVLAEKKFNIGQFDLGTMPLKHFEYSWGGGSLKLPSVADITPKLPSPSDIVHNAIDYAEDQGHKIKQMLHDKIREAGDNAWWPVSTGLHDLADKIGG